MINVLFILNDAPAEPGRTLNGLRLASSMSLRSSVYTRAFLLGSATACACRVQGVREREDASALLATIVRHGGEVKVCERCTTEGAASGDLIAGASFASLAELSTWVFEADRVLVF